MPAYLEGIERIYPADDPHHRIWLPAYLEGIESKDLGDGNSGRTGVASLPRRD